MQSVEDVRYGVRLLLRNPGFSAVAVLTLALGMGASTAVFSVINALILRPLPYSNPDRVVILTAEDLHPEKAHWGQKAGRWMGYSEHTTRKYPISGPTIQDMRKDLRSFEQIGWWESFVRPRVLTGRDEPQEVKVARISANLLPLLGLHPVIGRPFEESEERPGSDTVALLSHALWAQRFGADPRVIGATVTLGADTFTVVGVAPPALRAPAADVFIPLAFGRSGLGTGNCELTLNCWNFMGIGRLAAGVSTERARAELREFADRKSDEYKAGRDLAFAAVPISEYVVTLGARKPVLVLMGAVGLVLLIACANVANLLLMRVANRERELAVRMAIGAGRFRMMRQLLSESIVLWLFGAAGGVLFAFWGVDFLLAASPKDLPRINEVSIDWSVLAFTLAIALVTAVVFGLIPALQASRGDVNLALKEGRQEQSRRSRLRSALVVAEMALALVLVTGAGLLINTFVRVTSAPLGFQSENLLTMRVTLPRHKYGDTNRADSFYDELQRRISSLPGVIAAGAIDPLPLSGERNLISGKLAQNSEPFFTTFRTATAGYQRAMAIPVRRGRWFDERDLAGRGVVINESMARGLWPGENPLGRTVFFARGGDTAREVIGVTADTRHATLDREAGFEVYIPSRGAQNLVIRTHGDPLALAAAVRAEVRALDKDQPVEDVRAMERIISDWVAPWRFNMLVLGFFAAISAVLAAVGIYGVMAYAVEQRRRELGIRIAMGAGRGAVLRLVVGRGMALAVLGVALGIAGALAATRVLSGMLYGVRPTDQATLAAVCAVLLGVALLASWLPARKALDIDPATALRCE